MDTNVLVGKTIESIEVVGVDALVIKFNDGTDLTVTLEYLPDVHTEDGYLGILRGYITERVKSKLF